MSKKELAQLRAEVDAVPSTGRGRRFSPDLKARISRYVIAARGRGESWGALSEELSISDVSLHRWIKSSQGAPMRRVILRDPAPLTELTLTTRDGHRVTGLDVGSLAELLRQLG